jgi:hypothetical protein
LKNHCNIILPSMIRSSKWSLPSGLPTKTLIHVTSVFLLLLWGRHYVSCCCGCQWTECILAATAARDLCVMLLWLWLSMDWMSIGSHSSTRPCVMLLWLWLPMDWMSIGSHSRTRLCLMLLWPPMDWMSIGRWEVNE